MSVAEGVDHLRRQAWNQHFTHVLGSAADHHRLVHLHVLRGSLVIDARLRRLSRLLRCRLPERERCTNKRQGDRPLHSSPQRARPECRADLPALARLRLRYFVHSASRRFNSSCETDMILVIDF